MKFQSILLVLLLYCVPLGACAGEGDSLRYHSDFERVQFAALLADDPDQLQLLIAACPTGDEAMHTAFSGKVDQLFMRLESKKVRAKPVEKQVKLIFKEVHDSFLKRYLEEAIFTDLLETGTYNCVTASALYAVNSC